MKRIIKIVIVSILITNIAIGCTPITSATNGSKEKDEQKEDTKTKDKNSENNLPPSNIFRN